MKKGLIESLFLCQWKKECDPVNCRDIATVSSTHEIAIPERTALMIHNVVEDPSVDPDRFIELS